MALTKKSEERLIRLQTVFAKRFDVVVAKLDLSSKSMLEKREALTILDLLGLELADYQRNELESKLARGADFTAHKFKGWLRGRLKFMLYSYVSITIFLDVVSLHNVSIVQLSLQELNQRKARAPKSLAVLAVVSSPFTCHRSILKLKSRANSVRNQGPL